MTMAFGGGDPYAALAQAMMARRQQSGQQPDMQPGQPMGGTVMQMQPAQFGQPAGGGQSAMAGALGGMPSASSMAEMLKRMQRQGDGTSQNPYLEQAPSMWGGGGGMKAPVSEGGY